MPNNWTAKTRSVAGCSFLTNEVLGVILVDRATCGFWQPVGERVRPSSLARCDRMAPLFTAGRTRLNCTVENAADPPWCLGIDVSPEIGECHAFHGGARSRLPIVGRAKRQREIAVPGDLSIMRWLVLIRRPELVLAIANTSLPIAGWKQRSSASGHLYSGMDFPSAAHASLGDLLCVETDEIAARHGSYVAEAVQDTAGC